MVNANSDTVHLKFLKIVMGLKRNTPSMAVPGDSGQYPVSVIAYLNLLKYWHRICHLDDSCLVRKARNETTSIPNSKCDWKATVKTILNICSMEDVWENPLQFSINDLKVRFKCKLELFFEKYWKSKIDAAEIGNKGNSKLKHRKMLTKFRCSDHNLMIETGRHKQLKIEERICKSCHLRKIEDEIHFLLECPTYDNINNKGQNCNECKLHDLHHGLVWPSPDGRYCHFDHPK